MAGSVVIVGGGVIGTACAYALARTGWAVTLIDQGRMGGGCSHGNCGYVCPSHVLPMAGPGAIRQTLRTLFQRNSPLKLHPKVAFTHLGWFLRFARLCNERDLHASAEGIEALLTSSRRLYDTLLAEEAIDCEWDTNGLLFVFHTREAFEHYAATDELLRDRYGVLSECWGRDTAVSFEPALKPEATAGAYLYPADAQLRPDRLMAAWRGVLERQGVTIREQCTFQGLEIHGGQARQARTSQGELKADAFVIATGAWTPQLRGTIGTRAPIMPGKGYSITLPRPATCPRYPMIFEEHRVAISPFQSGFRIGSTMEFAGYDTSLNPARLGLLRDAAALYLHDPGQGPVQEEWWGWRPMVPDGKPIIDRDPAAPNVLLAAGHGMLGVSMATGTGQLVAELLNGSTPHIDPAHYALSRFR